MTDAPGPAWSQNYPWGRRPPAKRKAELEERRAAVLRRKRLLEDRFRELMIDVQRQLDAIDADMAIAQKCEQDDRRRAAKQIAYQLLTLGVDVLERIAEGDVSEAEYRELQELYARTSAAHPASESNDTLPDPENLREDGMPDPGLLDDAVVREDDIRIDEIRRAGEWPNR